MDRNLLIKKLNNLFCDLSKNGKKYSEVWLSDMDFGGLYEANKFVLNVKAGHQINSCSDEIREILYYLDKNAHEELQSIWSVTVYDTNDMIHCSDSNDLLVFNEANACPDKA
jgi:hypothetical protein